MQVLSGLCSTGLPDGDITARATRGSVTFTVDSGKLSPILQARKGMDMTENKPAWVVGMKKSMDAKNSLSSELVTSNATFVHLIV